MSYLSRAYVHDLRGRTNRYQHDTPTDRHRDVMSLFGELENNPRAAGGILFRLERPSLDAPYYLVRSEIEPVRDDVAETIYEDEFKFNAGAVVRFRIALNCITRPKTGPVQSIPANDWVDPESQIHQFVQRKLAPALTAIELINHSREVISNGNLRSKNASNRQQTLQIDVFDGIAEVQDPHHLAEILKTGVGREKAYGCGMLTVQVIN